jgi:hypothetical protein
MRRLIQQHHAEAKVCVCVMVCVCVRVCVCEREREREKYTLAHTRLSGGRRYRGRGKWIRGESFVSTRGECLRERARVYMCTENPGISVESLFLSLDLLLSLSLSSLSQIRIIQGLFLNVSAEYL